MQISIDEPDPNFAAELTAQIAALPKRGHREKRILAVLNMPDSRRKRRILARMERQAAAYLCVPVAEIDWSKVDWGKVLGTILKILVALLPLLI